MASIWINPLFEESDLISIYSNDQAIDDGIKFALGENLFITTNAANEVYPEWKDNVQGLAHLIQVVLGRLYNKGVYSYPKPATDQDANFATYTINGVDVWAVLDGDGLTFLLPSDY